MGLGPWSSQPEEVGDLASLPGAPRGLSSSRRARVLSSSAGAGKSPTAPTS